ncbi:MAG: hypothetical protein D8M58_16230 [Calditrichaeota bacterium]|nr:MAG: hypothetical protein DWQ03_07960 [Calditrichota bacterium]MBL1206954.1 hypothetical protein [Calditrichota bacterium]NOG46781.1 hypothetical protein [Calditrichota bacterium]
MKSIILNSLLFLLLACSSSNGPDNVHHPDWRYPVVEGLVFTDFNGNVLGEWKNPEYIKTESELSISNKNKISSYGWDKVQNILSVANPLETTTPSISISFSIPQSTHVLMYVVPAVLNPKDSVPNGNSANGSINIPGGLAIETLIDRKMPAGQHQVSLSGQKYKDGLYRYYLVTKYAEYHRDMILFNNPCNVPFELRDILYNIFPCK